MLISYLMWIGALESQSLSSYPLLSHLTVAPAYHISIHHTHIYPLSSDKHIKILTYKHIALNPIAALTQHAGNFLFFIDLLNDYISISQLSYFMWGGALDC